ncbi:hypothetical protein BJY00DRAFT_293449 [Aspergillus carlsbadensis]|nr:hypothetical protein BJY00DRAFT_293449 [Aspergillus carlsbadensis]
MKPNHLKQRRHCLHIPQRHITSNQRNNTIQILYIMILVYNSNEIFESSDFKSISGMFPSSMRVLICIGRSSHSLLHITGKCHSFLYLLTSLDVPIMKPIAGNILEGIIGKCPN